MDPDTGETTYAPLGERPAPYPPGFTAQGRFWTGREMVAAVPDPDAPNDTAIHDGLPSCRPAPVAGCRTARTSTAVRYLPDALLPAARLVELRQVSDDPGLLGMHGPRLWAGSGPDVADVETTRDPYTGPDPRLYEVRVGGVLVSCVHTAEGRHWWRAWRVPPVGPPMLVYAATRRRSDKTHLRDLSALLDRRLDDAFADMVTRVLAAHPGEPARAANLAAAVRRWRARVTMTEPAPNRRRERRVGKRAKKRAQRRRGGGRASR